MVMPNSLQLLSVLEFRRNYSPQQGLQRRRMVSLDANIRRRQLIYVLKPVPCLRDAQLDGNRKSSGYQIAALCWQVIYAPRSLGRAR